MLGTGTIRPQDFQTIAVELLTGADEGIALLTLNRPAERNSVDDRMHSELATIFSAVRTTSAIRVVVLTGAGEAFCSGGDSSPSRTFTTFTGLTPIEEARQIIDTFLDLSQPVVAAVNGDALGLGAILATLADVAYVAHSARIGDAHVRGAVTAGNGSSAIWPLLIGVNRSKELLLGGRILDAPAAATLGLVHEVVPDAEVLDYAMEHARAWAALPAFALQTTKRALNVQLKAAVAQVMPLSLALEEQSMAHEDFRAALAARRAAQT